MTMAQDLINANVSAIPVENLSAPIILLLEVTVPNKLIDNNNINNYNSIN